jgi:hypothetical protein
VAYYCSSGQCLEDRRTCPTGQHCAIFGPPVGIICIQGN